MAAGFGARGAIRPQPSAISLSMLTFAMAAGFSRAQVEAIAALANLELTPAELDLFAQQLGDILAYAEEVQQVDTAGGRPPATAPPLTCRDGPVPSPPRPIQP